MTKTMTRTILAALLVAAILLLFPASARSLEVFDSESAFLAQAGEVSSVDFADPSVPEKVLEPFLVIDDVHYEISAGRGAKCTSRSRGSCWSTSEDDGVRRLLSSAVFAVAEEAWAFGAGEWDVIRFGDHHSVDAFGFYFHSLAPMKPPGFAGWEILIHERDGTVTSVAIRPFTDDNKPVYRGFVSQTGIWMIDVGSAPGQATANWAYEAVSHSPIAEREGDVPIGSLDERQPEHAAMKNAAHIDNDQLQQQGGGYYDTKTKKPATGIVEVRHDNGQLRFRAYLEDGRKSGAETHWYPNGQISAEMFYVRGRKHGPQWEWHEGGEKQSHAAYYHGRMNGPAKWWHANGGLEIEATYRLGLGEGIERRWFDNGQLSSEVLYVLGGPEDTSTTWYASGQKQAEGRFTNGQRHGRFVTWYESGEVKSEAEYVQGKAEGLGTEWYENGNKSMTQEFSGGLRVGRQTQWYEGGQLKAELDFLDGQLHGRAAWYSPDGNLELDFYFRDGKLHGPGRQWHENGQLKSEGEFKNGKAVGKHRFWDENGRKLRSRPRDYPALPNTRR